MPEISLTIVPRRRLSSAIKEVAIHRYSHWLAAIVIALLPLTTRAVDVTVPGDYVRIQDAIDALTANPLIGDTVIVEPGTYTEHLQMSSNITVRGRETARTFLVPDGGGTTVTFIAVSDATIQNFTFLDADTGIDISSSNGITIASNVFEVGSSGTGITISDNSGVSVLNNTFYANNAGLIRTDITPLVRNNIFTNNTSAIAGIAADTNINYQCYNGNGIGTALGNFRQLGDPLFVDVSNRDFHLRTGSPCIDTGLGTDVIDSTTADMGAYGGDFADVFPFPVPEPTATDASVASPPPYNIELSWTPNQSYLVTDGSPSGGYKIYYDSDASGAPYDGTDAEDLGGSPTPSPVAVGNVSSYVLRNLSPAMTIPAAPVLQEALPSNQRIDLTWSAVAGATDYRVQYGIVDTSENAIDVGNITSYTLTGLVNNSTYHITVSTLEQSRYYLAVSVYDNTSAQNESVLSPETSLLFGPQRVSLPSNELTATPEKVVPYPVLPDEGCFIATAAYGYYSAPQVRALRNFRDQYLLTNGPGRVFVHWYYRNSPPAAHYISNHPGWKVLVRIALLPAVALAWLLTACGTAAFVGLFTVCLLMIVSWTLWRRRHRAGTL